MTGTAGVGDGGLIDGAGVGAEQGLAVHCNWLPTERLTDWQFVTESNVNSGAESDKFW